MSNIFIKGKIEIDLAKGFISYIYSNRISSTTFYIKGSFV